MKTADKVKILETLFMIASDMDEKLKEFNAMASFTKQAVGKTFALHSAAIATLATIFAAMLTKEDEVGAEVEEDHPSKNAELN